MEQPFLQQDQDNENENPITEPIEDTSQNEDEPGTTPYLETIEEVTIPPFCKLRINTRLKNRKLQEIQEKEHEDNDNIGLVNCLNVDHQELKKITKMKPGIAMLLAEYLMNTRNYDNASNI